VGVGVDVGVGVWVGARVGAGVAVAVARSSGGIRSAGTLQADTAAVSISTRTQRASFSRRMVLLSPQEEGLSTLVR